MGRRSRRSRSRSRARSTGGNRQTVSERIVVQMPRPATRGARVRAAAARYYNAPIVVRGRAAVRRHSEETKLPAMLGTALAGFLLGKVDGGSFPFPTIPLIGRAGTIAVAAGIMAKKHPMIAKLAIASAAIAGYEYGRNGVISGDDTIMGGVASQV